MENLERFERFFKQVSSWRQPAKKGYRIENVKYIALKLIDFCAEGRGRAVVFGDKDADGVFSSMVMATYLRRLMQIYQEEKFKNDEIGVDIRYSDRERDGFGLSKERYDELSEKYDLIVTTDNGTSADFHAFSIGNLIVTDHHPLNEGESIPEVPYVLNPNVWRTDGLEYSTSGGMVVYDLVKFIDKTLREQEKHYKAYLKDPNNYANHTRMLEVLKEFAAFTLISDMAVLDANNRRFVIEAMQSAKQKSDSVPLYGFFKNDFSQNTLSFNINPKINIDRMGELNTINPDTGKTYMESFLSPKTYAEFDKAKRFIEKVDKARKEITKRERNRILEEADTEASVIVAMCDSEDVRIGLGGLIANNLSRKFGKPAVVAVPTRDGSRLSFSGRGDNVKSIMSKALPFVGGHRDACGGSLPLAYKEEKTKRFLELTRTFTAISVPTPKKKEVIHNPLNPLSVDEVYALGERFKKLSKGVETTEDMLVAVYGAKVVGDVRNEWGTIVLKGERADRGLKLLVNTVATPLSEIRKAQVHLICIKANGTYSLEEYYPDTNSYLGAVIQNEKSAPYKIASEKNDLEIQTQKHTDTKTMLSSKEITKDDLFSHIFYYQDVQVLREAGVVDEAMVIIPSYTEDRNPLHKREDTIEIFVGKERGVPFEANMFKRNIVDFLGVAQREIKDGKQAVLVDRNIFDLLDEEQGRLVRMVIKNLSSLIGDLAPNNKNNTIKEERSNDQENHLQHA